ncbi:hypothetical protein NQ317_016135 [Molorchus minor]|uniref:Uncharacterized protein n=1 Tax=Molorchus minor TaxID=1323400 RepID=A0ABQ9J8I4_9CUCU|nr:hypothetical protein NQ317_016135 [Molorchus minor]
MLLRISTLHYVKKFKENVDNDPTCLRPLTPLTKFDLQIKQKFAYFIRRKPEAVTMENFRDVLTFGDMSGKPVDELAVLIEECLCPYSRILATKTGGRRLSEKTLRLT